MSIAVESCGEEQKERLKLKDGTEMDGGSGRPAPVAAKTRTCLASFHNLFSQLSDNNENDDEKVHEHIVDNLARFKIWAGSIGAYHVDNRSADHRLREAPEIRDRLMELLDEVLETNEELLAILNGRSAFLSEEDNPENCDHDVNTHEELIEICLAAGDAISSLLKVSGLLRKATGRDRYAKAAASNEPAFLEEFDIRHVKSKFPKLNNSSRLAEKLGRANILRRQYLRYARKHHDRLSHDPSHTLRPDVMTGEAPKSLLVPDVRPRTLASSRPTLAQTDASTLVVDLLPKAESGSLDIEDLDESQSRATSVMTSNAGYRERDGLEVIPLSEVCKDGEPFECPYCWSIIQSKRQRSWRRHVLRDIRAWTCTFPDCPSGLFEDRESWFNHELDHHRRQWACSSCTGAVFSSSTEMENHIRSHHGNVSIGALPNVLSASSRRATEISVSACPLCDEWEDSIRRQAPVSSTLPGVELTVPLKVFEQHLGHHLEQLALFSIPPNLERSAESKSSSGKKYNEALEKWQYGVEIDSNLGDEASINYTEASHADLGSNHATETTDTANDSAAPPTEANNPTESDTGQAASETLEFPAYQNADPPRQRSEVPHPTLAMPQESSTDSSRIGQVISQFGLHGDLLLDICGELFNIQEDALVDSMLSSLAKCKAIAAFIGESFYSMEVGLDDQVANLCNDSLQYIDDTIQRIMSKSSAAVEVRHEIEMISDSASRVYADLVNLYDRLLASASMASNAQPIRAPTERDNPSGRRSPTSERLEPPADPQLNVSEFIASRESIPQPLPIAAAAPSPQDLQRVLDGFTSQIALLRDICGVLNFLDQSTVNSAFGTFNDCLSQISWLTTLHGPDMHAVYRYCVQVLQHNEDSIRRLTDHDLTPFLVVEVLARIAERVERLRDFLVNQYPEGNP